MLKTHRLFLWLAFVGFLSLSLYIWRGDKERGSKATNLMRNLREVEPCGIGILPDPGPFEDQQQEEISEEIRQTLSNLRIAVFGTGNAYGAKLANRFSAYPYRLASVVLDNYAHYGNNNLNYFATCTQTAIGEDKYYDVIIFDFWLRFEQGLEDLVRKLRNRFPTSMFIFLKVRTISQFRRRESPNSTSSISFRQWKKDQGLTLKSSINLIIYALRNDEGFWYLPGRKTADEACTRIAQTYSGFNFTFPFQEGSDKENMVVYMKLFDIQNHDKLSDIGHASMARGIKGIIDKGFIPSSEALTFGHYVNNPFGMGDSCNLWYSSGTTHVPYSQTFEMKRISERRDLFALKIKNPGWIDITNPFDNWRTIYISFLTSPEVDHYPRLGIEWGAQSIIINPLNIDKKNQRQKTKTVSIGTIEMGTHRITLVPLGAKTQDYFSLIGITITDEVSLPIQYGFGPSYELEDDDEEDYEEEEDIVYVATKATAWNEINTVSE